MENNRVYHFLAGNWYWPETGQHTVILAFIVMDYLPSFTEFYKALEKFENNKSPGNDGLTAEFYRTFWPILGNLLVDSLNAAYINGKLSNSQRQAIIRLIEKKDKDRRYVENWRPISL